MIIKTLKSLIFLILITVFLTVALPANAAEFCRNIEGQKICILEIKRSAKNYWEYRVTVNINDIVKPQEIYNCRRQIKIKKDGSTVPFVSSGAGEFICSYF